MTVPRTLMAKRPEPLNPGRSRYVTGELRAREMADRLRWFVVTRWWAVLLGVVAALVAHLRWLPAQLDPRYFLAVAAMLALANLGATLRARRGFADLPAMRWFLFWQMLTDFAALSVVTYALGTVETPVVTLFMLHIILATQFFPRRYSQVAAGVAWLFASAPLLLEYTGVIPVMSIFDSQVKAFTSGSLRVTLVYVASIGLCYAVCQSLVSVIASSLKGRERQLEEAFEMLQRMDHEKSQSTLRATHELKAPFAAIKSYVYTLKEGYCGELPEKAGQVVTRIGERCDRLTEKIADIIHLSNLRSLLQRPESFVPTDLRTLLDEEIRDAALLAAPTQVTVALLPLGPPVFVTGNAALLRTLFSNLLRNAVHYSRAGGEISVTLDSRGAQAVMEVVDHGIGIPEGNLEKIFEEHFRSNNAVAHHPGGTGLGLPIVREIVRLHGGDVKVTSALDRGTTVTVTLATIPPPGKRGSHGEGADH